MKTYDMTPPNTGSYATLVDDLMNAPKVHTGEWQTIDTSKSPVHATHELEDITLLFDPTDHEADQMIPHVDIDWAVKHMAERVSGEPLNPAPSHVDWPYAVGGNGQHIQGGKFDHTYPERFWPRFAAVGDTRPNGRQVFVPHNGIRFEYGDLNDLVNLIVTRPLTRQAFLPVWFPEDTGAVSGQRVPCTLGYHFMVRDRKLSCRYYLRSCDIYRHFSNDVFFAKSLQDWVCHEVNRRTLQGELERDGAWDFNWKPITPGRLVMHIASLHMFAGDKGRMKNRLDAL